jgi:uncharacterized protein (DUF58 family)
MPDSPNYFHPETLRRIARLDFRARHVVEGFLSGMHKSRHFGNSVEFRQHREYVAGDDPKNVDWKVWARQDRLYVKQFEEDTNLNLTLLVDASSSMTYGSEAMTKYDYGATVAASLAYLALRQQDAVGCLTFDRRKRTQLPFRTRQSHLAAVVQTLMDSDPSRHADDETDVEQTVVEGNREKESASGLLRQWQPNLEEVLLAVAESTPRHGMIVLLSDLLVDRQGLFRGLRLLQSHGHDVMVFHLLDDEELDFPLSGATRFEGLEMPLHLRCDPRMLRDAYLDAMEAYLGEVRRGCTKIRADYTLFRTSRPLDAALAEYLSFRADRVRAHHVKG